MERHEGWQEDNRDITMSISGADDAHFASAVTRATRPGPKVELVQESPVIDPIIGTLKGKIMLHVIAVIETKPGQRDAVLAAMRENIPAVRAEPGCVEYIPAIDIDGVPSAITPLGPNTFVVIEKWESREALLAHAVAPHMAAYQQRVKELLVSRKIHVLEGA